MVDELLRQAPTPLAVPAPGAGAAGPLFARGDLVQVRRYGRGVVEEASATQVTVAFSDRSRRSFLPEYVRRAVARRPPAPRPAAQASP